ncbi:MAG TPA: four helix bundle protein [Gemmatimonadales bacterium]|nr:four helix bundle protein [Gemmatimonadales bacterium]
MRDYRQLEAWQEARATTLMVYGDARKYWHPSVGALFHQLQRSALSVQLNIAEGASFGNSPTFTRFLGIAYGSAVETGEVLRLLLDLKALPTPLCNRLLEHSTRCQRLLLGLLKKRRPMGMTDRRPRA